MSFPGPTISGHVDWATSNLVFSSLNVMSHHDFWSHQAKKSCILCCVKTFFMNRLLISFTGLTFVVCFITKGTLKACPNARNILTQHLATFVARGCDKWWSGWPNARNIRNIFNATCHCLCAPGPWRATSWPSAHALLQQCCVNVAKRVQHHATSKKLREKFDRFQIWSNIIQHVATYRNISQQGGQMYATCCAQQCCKMLQWNVACVWWGLKQERQRRLRERHKTIGLMSTNNSSARPDPFLCRCRLDNDVKW